MRPMCSVPAHEYDQDPDKGGIKQPHKRLLPFRDNEFQGQGEVISQAGQDFFRRSGTGGPGSSGSSGSSRGPRRSSI